MGTDSPSSPSDTPTDASSDPSAPSGTYEKWLVRILLTLAFGLAFGIEGMTLLRSFVFDPVPDDQVETSQRLPVLKEGDVLTPGSGPTVRVHRLRLFATDEAWTFTLVARPDSALAQRYTIAFDTLRTTNGRILTSAPTRTWAVSDTSSFEATWSLPPGHRPDALTIRATSSTASDSTTTTVRRMDVGHVPVRMQ